MAKDKLMSLADELEQVLDFKALIEAELEPVKEKEEQIREQLLKGLNAKGYSFVRTTSGMGFGIVQGKKTFTIKKGREREAVEWATTNYPSVLSISKPDLGKVLKPMLSIPEFFEEKVGEPHLAVRLNEEDAPLMPQHAN